MGWKWLQSHQFDNSFKGPYFFFYQVHLPLGYNFLEKKEGKKQSTLTLLRCFHFSSTSSYLHCHKINILHFYFAIMQCPLDPSLPFLIIFKASSSSALFHRWHFQPHLFYRMSNTWIYPFKFEKSYFLWFHFLGFIWGTCSHRFEFMGFWPTKVLLCCGLRSDDCRYGVPTKCQMSIKNFGNSWRTVLTKFQVFLHIYSYRVYCVIRLHIGTIIIFLHHKLLKIWLVPFFLMVQAMFIYNPKCFLFSSLWNLQDLTEVEKLLKIQRELDEAKIIVVSFYLQKNYLMYMTPTYINRLPILFFFFIYFISL